MPYVPLVEHTRPRVLMLDFSAKDVEKISKAGFDARRGASGLHDKNQFNFPFAVQDVEVVFAEVRKGTFVSDKRTPSVDSIEKEAYFKDLFRETWEKCGWIVFFISQGTSPEELTSVELRGLGIIAFEHHYYPESIRASWLAVAKEELSRRTIQTLPILPSPQLPNYKGHGVNTDDKQPTLEILQRFFKSAHMAILTCLNVPPFIYRVDQPTSQPYIEAFGEAVSVEPLIWDDSADHNIIALKLNNRSYAVEGRQYVGCAK